jgi:hypothetical protein
VSQISRPSQFAGLEVGLLSLQRTFNVAKAVNGGIDFGNSAQTAQGPGSAYSGNMNGQWVNVTTPSTANAQFAIAHNLNRIPSHYHYITDNGGVIYQLPNTGTAWTATNIYVKCSTASATLRIFIM